MDQIIINQSSSDDRCQKNGMTLVKIDGDGDLCGNVVYINTIIIMITTITTGDGEGDGNLCGNAGQRVGRPLQTQCRTA